MSVRVRFRDALRFFVPPWLSDRYPALKSVGFRYLWTMVASLDVAAEVLLEGLQAPWPGAGTPTALTEIGKSRGLIRGFDDTDDDYAAYLRGWLERARGLGSQLEIATRLHHYLTARPQVRVVNRAGQWVTVNADGSISRAQQTFDWDSVSNPERAGNWSEMWIIIYKDPWSRSGNYGAFGTWGQTIGLGHSVSREEYDAVKAILATVKSAHSMIRAVIFTVDPTLFDPTVPASLPDGQWGQWSITSGGHAVASHRNTTSCRFWEPN